MEAELKQRKLVLYIAASLDGYIATEDENLDWLMDVEGEGDNGYSKFYDTIDTVLIGRMTYDWIMQHENGQLPYKNKECFVFSRTKLEDTDQVKFISENIVDFANELKNKKGKKIWLVGGGKLLHTFIEERLVDEFIINFTPTILGKGIPLFKDTSFMTNLKLNDVNRYGQFAELSYEIIR